MFRKLHRHKLILTIILTATLTLGTLSTNASQAATTLNLSKKSITITVGKSTMVTANKKINKWKSSNKAIASVKKVTNRKAKITARKKGSCNITATNGKKTVRLKVIVHPKVTATKVPTITNIPAATSTTVVTNIPEATATISVATNTPIVTETPITTATPSVVETPTVSVTPILTKEPTVTEVPVTTNMPEATASSTVTETPTHSTLPTITEEPTATEVPVITTTPAVTATPSAMATTSPASIVAITNVHASFNYNGNNKSIMKIENDNAVDFQFYTNGYYLEQKIDDTWMPLPSVAIYRQPVSAILKANSNISYSIDYLEDYGTLEYGAYRIVVPLFYTALDDTEATVYYVHSEFTIEDFSTEKVAMTVTPNANNKVSITIENNNSYPIQLDQATYDIQLLETDTWLPLPSAAIIRPVLPMTIAGNCTGSFSINYTEYYGFLPAGTYRMVLPVSQFGNTNKDTILYSTFSIK